MDKNIHKISILLINLTILITPISAEMPYRLEVQEIPITGYGANTGYPQLRILSIYQDTIAYRSGFGKISLYNITSNKTKVLISYQQPLEIRDVMLDNNHIFYKRFCHKVENCKTKLKMYDISKNKTYDIDNSDLYTNYFVRDNTLLYTNGNPRIPAEYNILTYRTALTEDINKRARNIYANNLIISNTLKNINESIYYTKLYNILTGNITYFPKWFDQIRNNKLLGETYVYDLTLQKGFSLSEEFSKKNCGGKMILSETGVWALSNSNSKNTNLCYFDFNLNFTFSGIGPSRYIDKYECYKDVFVFLGKTHESGNGYLASIKYGNLTQICKDYSEIRKFKNTFLKNNCSLVNQSVCLCQISGNEFVYNHTVKENFSFKLINSQDSDIKIIIDGKFNKIENQLEKKITKTENSKIQKIKEEQSEKESLYFNTVLLIFFLICILIIGLTYFKNKKSEKEKAIKKLDNATNIILSGKNTSKIFKNKNKKYIKLYKQAVDLFNQRKYKKSKHIASEAIDAKKYEEKIEKEIKKIEKIDLMEKIKYKKEKSEKITPLYKEITDKWKVEEENIKQILRKKLKKSINDINNNVATGQTTKPLRDKYLEIKKKFKQGKYSEVEKLITELWSAVEKYKKELAKQKQKAKEKRKAEQILQKFSELTIKPKIKEIQEIYEKAQECFESGEYGKLDKLIDDATELRSKILFERKQKAKEKRKAEQILLEIYELTIKPKIKEIQEIYEKAQECFESGEYGKLDKLIDDATELRSKILFERKQKAKGLVKFTEDSGKEMWGTPTQVKKWKEIDIDLNNNFVNLNGYQFEEFIAKLFKKMGYKVTITPKSRDYGIDVIAEDKEDIIAIQCKKLKAGSNVSNRDIQRARGSMDFYDANKCIIITNQDFTIQAKEQARRTKNTEIWNKHILHQMVRRYFIDA